MCHEICGFEHERWQLLLLVDLRCSCLRTDGPINRDVSLASSELETGKQNEGESSHAGGEQLRLMLFSSNAAVFQRLMTFDSLKLSR